jgi:hypothetical protein
VRSSDESTSRACPEDDNVTIELDGVALTSERASRYQDWAERLRAKREQSQRQIRRDEPDEMPSYWRTEHVYNDHAQVTDDLPPRMNPVVQQLLGVLGLAGEPAPAEIEAAFRLLAKQHHPDRHVDADEVSREYHLDQMRRVNEAYARLRELQLV